MSSILSADDLNDFISPGVACIKPVETLPPPPKPSNQYEVTTEDQQQYTAELQTAQISLTDCLACSGCVTSAEAVLVSLQSHNEVLSELDAETNRRRVFVASVSPQSRASLAAALSVSTDRVGDMIDHLLLDAISREDGGGGGKKKRAFDYVVDTEPVLSICLRLAVKEVIDSLGSKGGGGGGGVPKRPILTSDCPGFICYLEKTHPGVLPHLSRLKSPQAVLGTLLKTLLPRALGDDGVEVYHVAIMPCFDKKLEASRQELTDAAWKEGVEMGASAAQRDVDCVITTKELLQLAAARNVDFASLPQTPMVDKPSLPDTELSSLLLDSWHLPKLPSVRLGTSGGYLSHVLASLQSRYGASSVVERKGRNADVVEYVVLGADGRTELAKAARYYGFRNIQNLVRKLKPPKVPRLPGSRKVVTARQPASSSANSEYAYVEVMACPGGCTNGGGQLKPQDTTILSPAGSGDPMEVDTVQVQVQDQSPLASQLASKDWLAKVDEAYYSDDEAAPAVPDDGEHHVDGFLGYWVAASGIPLEKLAYTTYRAVESDVGKQKSGTKGEISTLQAAELASKAGGGW